MINPSRFTAGVVQFDVQPGRVETNMATLLGYLESLADQGADLAVLPEMFSCSFDNDHLTRHAGKTKAVMAQLCRFARDKKMVIAGSLPVLGDQGIFNTMIFIDKDGTIKARYAKLHLFGLTGEDRYYQAGEEIGLADSVLGPAGMMVCYDLRFPELARQLCLNGARMILISAQWPKSREHHWQMLAVARAIENQLFVICANRTGSENELVFPGRSMIIDPSGQILADAGSDEGIALAQIDMAQIEAVRKTIPCMTDRRTDIYG